MLCFGAAGGVPTLAASQETDIDVVVLRAFSALSEGDVDAYLSEVRPGARVIVHYSETLELHVDEWRESLSDVTWEPGQLSSRVSGNTAVTVTQLDGTLRMPGGDALDGPWRFAETRIRDQGTWRIVQLELSAVDPAADAVVEVGARRPAADAGETGRIAGVTSGRAAASARQITDPPAPVGGAMINQAVQDGATLRAVRVNEPLEIDGVIEEPFYQSVPPITEFVQVVPEEDGEPSEFTEVWIGFDDDNVYVTAKIWYAAGSDGWIANEMRRDSRRLASNDHFGVWFDTFYDRRNAVGFYGNAIGGVIDMQITNEGSPNFDWNPLREIRTALFDGGWSIEMAIPFKSLRYRPGREQVWGIQMRRFIGRRNEWEYIRAVPLSVASDGWQGIFRVSMYGTLMGIEAPPPSRNLEVKPYVISGLDTNLVATPQIDRDGYADAGLDIKYGITENLTADLTFNTDFAQVEVDEQQVNLTRFSLFFPEKREFFLEGRGIFNFGLGGIGGGGGGFGGGGAPTLFYSRQIGLEGGQAVPILGGGRVTGKVGSFDLGLINIQTNDSRPFDLGSLSRDREVQAESTNFSVFRLRRDIFSRSSIGVLFENRDKAVASTGSNQAWGVDGSFGLSDELSLLAYYAQTRTEGLEGLDVSYRGQLSYDAHEWGGSINHLLVGADFNPEIGFVRRKDFRQTSGTVRFGPRPESVPWIRQLTFQVEGDYLENEQLGYVESKSWGGQFGVELENSDRLNVSYANAYEGILQPERISGALVPAGRYDNPEMRVSYSAGPQRRVSGSVSFRRGDYYDGTLTAVGLNRWRIEVTPQLSVEPSVSFNWIDLPHGRFDQHVAVTRVTYTLTPRAHLSGLVQYNSGSDTFGGNFRFRWEWAPGSELFVVYTEDRDTGVLDRWSQLQSRGFVIKINRLLRI